ncbi:MAG: hypothetical protein V4850_17620 [Myxococcota bacterium]
MINELFMCVRGGHRAARGEHGALLVKHVDDEALECLAAALRAPGADPIQPDDDDEGDDALYTEVSPLLLEALAATDEEELRRVGERWMDLWIADLGTIPAYRGVVPATARPTLDGEWGWWPALQRFAALARAARQRGWSVYLRSVL